MRTGCPPMPRCRSRSTSCRSRTTTQRLRLADLIEGVAGQFSPFEQLHGFSIDSVELETSALPEGRRDRMVKVPRNALYPLDAPLAGRHEPADEKAPETPRIPDPFTLCL